MAKLSDFTSEDFQKLVIQQALEEYLDYRKEGRSEEEAFRMVADEIFNQGWCWRVHEELESSNVVSMHQAAAKRQPTGRFPYRSPDASD